MFYTSSEIFCNSKCRIFPDGSKSWTVCNEQIFKPKGFECVDESIRKAIENRPEEYNTDGVSRSDSVSRARKKIYDIAKCNPFEIFVTFTLDEKKIDRYDRDKIGKAIKTWLNNNSIRHEFIYLIVPECHNDGAVHFHGLLTKGSLKLIDSGHKDSKGHTVYNLPQWKYGFSTAIEVYGDFDGACKYITKYITKDTDKKILGNFYLSGGKGIIREPETELYNLEFSDYSDLKQFSVPDMPNRKFVYPDDITVRQSLGEVIIL